MSALTSTVVTVRKVGKHCGAEISGVDLSQPLDDETFAEIRDVFFEHEVVFFRNQRLTPQQQVDFTRRFGDLEHHVRKESLFAGFPEILVISNILDEKGSAIGSQDAGRFWHSDVSYKAEPSMLSALYALEVPITKDGTVLGHTNFASSTAAYDALPDTMKHYLAGKKNVHSYRDYRRKNLEAQREELARGGRVIQEHAVTEEQLRRVPDIEVPVVRTHPVNGRKGLFVNEGHTSGMADMPKEEGDALLAELYRHITQPQFIYRHDWQAGDLLMWDNCAVQHKASFDYDLPLRRLMHRTTVRGTAPF